MKTLIAYNSGETGDTPQLYIAEGNWSHLDGVNLDGESDERDELRLLLWGIDGDGEKVASGPTAEPIKKQGAITVDFFACCVNVP